MAKAIIFDTDFTAREEKIDIKDGRVIIDDKEFFVDKIQPILIKGKFKTTPIYFFKWNELYGLNWKIKNNTNSDYIEFDNDKQIVRELVPLRMEFDNMGITKVTPELYKTIGEMKFLKNMKNYASDEKKFNFKSNNLMLILIFAVVFIITTLISYTYMAGGG